MIFSRKNVVRLCVHAAAVSAILLLVSCRGYGIRIEFVTPEETKAASEKPAAASPGEAVSPGTAALTPAEAQKKQTAEAEVQPRTQGQEEAAESFTTAFQNWSSAHSYLVRTLEGGTGSPALIQPEIMYVRGQLRAWPPFFPAEDDRRKEIAGFAEEYEKLSLLYTWRRRQSTAELLTLLGKRITRFATEVIRG